MTLDERLEQIVLLLGRLVEEQNGRDREWCRLGRNQTEKQTSGRGAFPAWSIGNEELLRYRRQGLRPAALPQASKGTEKPQFVGGFG